MKKLVFQTCESKECYMIEKDKVGLKNLYVVSRRHIFDDETSGLTCTTCGKVTNINDIKIQDLKDLKKIEKAAKKNKSGQTTVDTEKINIMKVSGHLSGHNVLINNVIIEQKVIGENVIEVKKTRGRPKKA
jgi:hypothetical protein